MSCCGPPTAPSAVHDERMGELSPWHWAIVIIVLVVLFGARRLPDAARSLGRSARILKSELRANDAPTPDAQAEAVMRCDVMILRRPNRAMGEWMCATKMFHHRSVSPTDRQ